MTAREAAAALGEIAMLLEVVGGNPFRAKAFQSAARTLETSSADLTALAAASELRSIRGVGEGIAGVLNELVTTGTSRMLEELREQTPVGLYDVMRIKGVGTKRGRTLFKELGIDSLEKLEEAATAGRLAALPGFGAKTEQVILQGVAFARSMRGRRRYHQAVEAAAALLELVEGLPGVTRASSAGQVRRRLEVIDSIDMVAASEDPETVLAAFRALQGVDVLVQKERTVEDLVGLDLDLGERERDGEVHPPARPRRPGPAQLGRDLSRGHRDHLARGQEADAAPP